jgi:hypothetical protein
MAATMWIRLGLSGAEIGMGSIANVSTSGAFLETKVQLPINARITVELASSAGVAAREGLKLDARVARVDSRGLGIEWRVMATPQILALLTAPSPRPPFALNDDARPFAR